MSARQRDVQQTRYDLINGGRVQIDNDQTLSGESDGNARGKIKPVSNEAIWPAISANGESKRRAAYVQILIEMARWQMRDLLIKGNASCWI